MSVGEGINRRHETAIRAPRTRRRGAGGSGRAKHPVPRNDDPNGRAAQLLLAAVSHDLRAPLTAVRAGIGLIEMSAAERLTPDEERILSNVRRNVERLAILVDELITYDEVQSHRPFLLDKLVDLREVANTAAKGVAPLIAEKNQTLEIAMPVPLRVKGDGGRLAHVMTNLLDNAHRHTPEGTHIKVEGMCAGGEVLVMVSDDGPGIPPEDAERIFDRFERGARANKGWGLGLTIVRAVVERHGGSVWLKSGPHPGATFVVALPSTGTVTSGPSQLADSEEDCP